MSQQVNCIMLVDDNPDDNFYHERVIMKNHFAMKVVAMKSGPEALYYLKNQRDNKAEYPELIFLDINMPGMNGWEFLGEFCILFKEPQNRMVIVMLTTSENPHDKEKAGDETIITDFRTKPLTREVLSDIIETYFSPAGKKIQ